MIRKGVTISRSILTFRKSLLALAASGAAMAIAAPAAAKDCGDMAKLALDKGKVTSATLVAAGTFQPPAGAGPPPGVANSAYKDVPAFCRIQATMTPTSDSDIKVEIWLPAEGWNGKLVGIGNGVWAGSISYSELGPTVARGYAAVATDTGHVGNGMTAEWAVGHPEKLVDFGYRAIHVMTVAAKQAIGDYYGKKPEFSIWNSCSTGGRQGLMAAARYPNDFDGISSKAPANPMTDLMTQSMWMATAANLAGETRLTPALLGMAHKAVIAKCDALDGLADGIVGRPDACTFKAAELSCKPGQTEGCLNANQSKALQAFYDGVTDKSGKKILPGWPVGSETQLAMLIMGRDPFPVANDYYRLLVHGNDKSWDWRTMDYAKETQLARTYGAEMLNVAPEDLKAFLARGGKLLLSHGWTDGLIPASNTVKLYGGLEKVIPAAQRDKNLRLFMVPGMDHCGGGEGASDYDTLGAVDKWLTTGVAPERIVAKRGGGGGGMAMPGAPKLPPISRPLCVYPKVAVYDGKGDQASEASFSCQVPKK